jgi:hypothetical protein
VVRYAFDRLPAPDCLTQGLRQGLVDDPAILDMNQPVRTFGCGLIHVSQARVVGYTPRPDRQAQVTRLMDTISWKVSVSVGGDGSPTPLTDSLRLIV